MGRAANELTITFAVRTLHLAASRRCKKGGEKQGTYSLDGCLLPLDLKFFLAFHVKQLAAQPTAHDIAWLRAVRKWWVAGRWLVRSSWLGDVGMLGGREHGSDRTRVRDLRRVVSQAVNSRQSQDAGCIVMGGSYLRKMRVGKIGTGNLSLDLGLQITPAWVFFGFGVVEEDLDIAGVVLWIHLSKCRRATSCIRLKVESGLW